MGQSSQIPCGHCGTLNDASDQFCSNCGYLLAGGATGTVPAYSGASTVSASARRTTGALFTGFLLGARYRVAETAGKGGFGAVYKATDERFKSRRTVAIKEMSDAHLTPAERVQALDDFRQEADLLVQLKHPNLPDVSDFFEEGGKAYLVMEFIAGKTLEKIQDETGAALDERIVLGWALQLCDVLHYLHSQPQPIIFRDLKPSNVMVTPIGQVKLIDFGIARIFKSSSARDTTTLGSRGYAPMEQYGQGQSDARSDIYALGATLYDLLTHEVPVDAPVRRINPLTFRKPSQLNPAVSQATERIILKAMAELPKDRYQSAAEMFQAIAATGLASGSLAGAATQPGIPTTIAALPQASTQAAASTTPVAPTMPAVKPLPAPTLPAAPMPSGTPPLVLPATATQYTPSGAASQTIPAGQATIPSQLPQQSMQQSAASQQAVGGAAHAIAPVNIPSQHQPLVSPNPTPPATYPVQAYATPPTAPPTPPAAGPLPSTPGARPVKFSRRTALIGGLVAAGTLLGGGYLISRSGAGKTTASGGTIPIAFAYSTEKDQWLKAAINSFNNSSSTRLAGSNKTIQPVLLDNSGSLDIADKILSGSVKPIIWSPASRVELNRLNYKWMNAHGGQEIIPSSTDLAPLALVQSPIVLAVWKSRAHAFRATNQAIDWEPLHKALLGKGWRDFGHPEWGSINIGQTNPTLSNSGLLSIILMTYAYVQKTNGPQHLDPAYITNSAGLWQYIETFDNAVGIFGSSSGTYFTDTVLPQGEVYSVVITYENLVLYYQQQAKASAGEALEIYYPGQEIVSDHPFAILDAPWVSDEEKAAARQLRDFLRSHDQQTQALQYGFRSSDPSISLAGSTIANTPFQQLSQLAPASTFDTRTSPQVLIPDGAVVEALISQWKKHYPGA